MALNCPLQEILDPNTARLNNHAHINRERPLAALSKQQKRLPAPFTAANSKPLRIDEATTPHTDA